MRGDAERSKAVAAFKHQYPGIPQACAERLVNAGFYAIGRNDEMSNACTKGYESKMQRQREDSVYR